MLERLRQTVKQKAEFCPRGCVWDYDGYDKYLVGERDGGNALLYHCMRCDQQCEYRRDPDRPGPTAPVWISPHGRTD